MCLCSISQENCFNGWSVCDSKGYIERDEQRDVGLRVYIFSKASQRRQRPQLVGFLARQRQGECDRERDRVVGMKGSKQNRTTFC